MKKLALPALLVFSIACGSAEKQEAMPEVDSSLVRELDSAVKVAPDTTARRDTANATKKKAPRKKADKKKQTAMSKK